MKEVVIAVVILVLFVAVFVWGIWNARRIDRMSRGQVRRLTPEQRSARETEEQTWRLQAQERITELTQELDALQTERDDAIRMMEIARDDSRWLEAYGREQEKVEKAERQLAAARELVRILESYRRQPIRTFAPADEAAISKQELIENVFLDAWLPKLRTAFGMETGETND